jgi:hypothetical protein
MRARFLIGALMPNTVVTNAPTRVRTPPRILILLLWSVKMRDVAPYDGEVASKTCATRPLGVHVAER